MNRRQQTQDSSLETSSKYQVSSIKTEGRKLDDYFEKAGKLIDNKPPFLTEELLTKIQNSKDISYLSSLSNKFKIPFKSLMLLGIVSLFLLSLNDSMDRTLKQASLSSGRYSVASIQHSVASNWYSKDTRFKTQDTRHKIKAESQLSDITQPCESISQIISETKVKNESKIQNSGMLSVVDENHILPRPFNISKKDGPPKSSVMTASRSKEPDMSDAVKLMIKTKGEPIAGITILELSSEELKNLGIVVNDDSLIYMTESWDRIHPIPFRVDDNYHYSDLVYPNFKAGYPVTGDTFLLKKMHSIDLNYKYDSERDTIIGIATKLMKKGNNFTMDLRKVYDTIDGNPVILTEAYYKDSDNKEILGMSMKHKRELKDKMIMGYKQEIIKYTGWNKDSYSALAPVCIAFSYNPIVFKHQSVINDSPLLAKSKDKFILDYSELLPLTIKFGKSKIIEKIVFWFVPSEALISKLPYRYQSALRREVSIINSIRNDGIPEEKACSAMKDTSFFDICRLSSGAVTIDDVYPNPIEKNGTLSFELKEEREITVSLYDFSGKFIGNFVENVKMAAGEHEMPIIIKDISSGFYLLAVKTNKGEIAARRIVVNM